MFRTVLVIAHNEESRIVECLASLARQTVATEQIVVVAHNCADQTAGTARKTAERLGLENVVVDEWKTEGVGPIFARMRAFELAQHESVACIDGDSIAEPDWLEKITAPLENPDVSAAGGKVRFRNDLFGNLASFWFFDMGKFSPWRHFYFWGANFACRKSAYEKIGGLGPFVKIRQELGLHYWAEDCHLSLALEKSGRVVYVPDAKVAAYPGKTPNTVGRGRKQESDRKKLFEYWGIR